MAIQQREVGPRRAPGRGIAGPLQTTTKQTENVVGTSSASGSGRAGIGADLLELQRRHGNQYVIGVVRRLRRAGPVGAMDSAVHDVAASGVRGAGRRLPHADQVEQALGPHRLDAVQAYTDAGARAASRDLGAEAYTVGDMKTQTVAGSPRSDRLHKASRRTSPRHISRRRRLADEVYPLGSGADGSFCQRPNSLPTGSLQTENQPMRGTGPGWFASAPSSFTRATPELMSSTSK